MNASSSLKEILGTVVRDALRDLVREEIRGALAGTAIEATLRNASDGYLPVAKAARVAAVAPGTIRAWIRSGRLSARRAGRVLRVDRAELEAFMTNGGAPPVDPSEIRRKADTMLGRPGSPSRKALRSPA